MEFIEDEEFTTEWFSLGLNDDYMWAMQNEIASNPSGSPICPGMAGARKIRIPMAGRGKSGGLGQSTTSCQSAILFICCGCMPKKIQKNCRRS